MNNSINRNKENKLLEWNWKKIKYHENTKADRKNLKRGQVVFVDFGENIGSEQNGIRPCVIIQTNVLNKKSPVLVVAIITNGAPKMCSIHIPIVNVYNYIDHNNTNKTLSGYINLGQIFTISKRRIISSFAIVTLKDEINDLNCKLLNIFDITFYEKNLINLEGKVNYYKNMAKELQSELEELKKTSKLLN